MYSNSRQRMIATTCCDVHNFICKFAHSNEMFKWWEDKDCPTGNENLMPQRCDRSIHALRLEAVVAIGTLCEQMTEKMWSDYCGGGN